MSLRILMTLDAVGGVWRYATDLAEALIRNGHKVVLAGLGPRPTPAQRREAETIAILEWGDVPLDWLASAAEDLSGAQKWLDDMVARHAIDVLHLNQPALAAHLRNGPPRVTVTHSCLATWFHTMDGGNVPDHLAWQVAMTSAGLVNSDCVVAPSAAHAAVTKKVYGLSDVVAVPNGSRAPLVYANAGDSTVVAAARWWDRAKNGALLDRVAGMTDARITMIGSGKGPDGQEFVPKNLPAPSALPHRETLQRVAEASLFVSPSLYEPFGLAALEAARAGRPLLLADIPVYRQVWGEAACFFDPHDPGHLGQMIDTLLRSPAERIKRGVAAQKRALRYSMADQAAAMTDIYQGITARARVSMTS